MWQGSPAHRKTLELLRQVKRSRRPSEVQLKEYLGTLSRGGHDTRRYDVTRAREVLSAEFHLDLSQVDDAQLAALLSAHQAQEQRNAASTTASASATSATSAASAPATGLAMSASSSSSSSGSTTGKRKREEGTGKKQDKQEVVGTPLTGAALSRRARLLAPAHFPRDATLICQIDDPELALQRDTGVIGRLSSDAEGELGLSLTGREYRGPIVSCGTLVVAHATPDGVKIEAIANEFCDIRFTQTSMHSMEGNFADSGNEPAPPPVSSSSAAASASATTAPPQATGSKSAKQSAARGGNKKMMKPPQRKKAAQRKPSQQQSAKPKGRKAAAESDDDDGVVLLDDDDIEEVPVVKRPRRQRALVVRRSSEEEDSADKDDDDNDNDDEPSDSDEHEDDHDSDSDYTE